MCLMTKTVLSSSHNRAGDLEQLVKQVRAQLKKIAITDKSRVDEMFLRYDRDRTGYIGVENMRDLCRRLQLPVDDDVIMGVSRENREFFAELSALHPIVTVTQATDVTNV